MLDFRRERLQDDLRGLVKGEVLCDTVYTQPFATDASIYEISPLGVVFPKSTADIIAVVRYAREHGIAVHPRGAGSNTSGGALGEGIVLDISRHMRRLLMYQQNTIKVQAGAQCTGLRKILQARGVTLGIGDGCSATTIGGLLSIDGSVSNGLSNTNGIKLLRKCGIVPEMLLSRLDAIKPPSWPG